MSKTVVLFGQLAKRCVITEPKTQPIIQLVKELMVTEGLSRKEMAARLGVSYWVFDKALVGRNQPTIQLVTGLFRSYPALHNRIITALLDSYPRQLYHNEEKEMGQAPNWQTPARAAFTVPGTEALKAELTSELMQSELRILGPELLKRLPASATFAVLTLPPEQRQSFAWANAYIIEWVFALDAVMDTIPTLDYASDLRLLIEQRVALAVGTKRFGWRDLGLAHDPDTPYPGLEFSAWTLIDTLQVLRHRIFEEAVDEAGLRLFDRYLLSCILPSMEVEAKWRLAELPYPDYEDYLSVAWISISGGLCAATVAAVLPNPAALLGATGEVTRLMLHATRLRNDLATVRKEQQEGTPNAVLLLERELGSREAAEQRVREQIDGYAAKLYQMCEPQLHSDDSADPLYIMYHYIWMCWAITMAMYAPGDFVAPTQAQ